MATNRRRSLAALVFVVALVGFFCYHAFLNDHFDRLARARQIAVYGDVPFRDFFDPGYFLTLYTSAFLQRLFGDNLLGEALLNITSMAAGATLVFLLAARISGSALWGLIAAGLTVLAEPRPYDYDKVFFYPLGLYVCWRYIDRPSMRSLALVAATAAIAGLFRYDSGIYIGAAALVGVTTCHWGEWRQATQRLATLGALTLLIASPALIFVQSTAGLGEAYHQIATYAEREGGRSSLFRMSKFDVDWFAPLVDVNPSDGKTDLWKDVHWFEGFNRVDNAAAWLHWLAVSVPLIVVALLPLRTRYRERAALARLLCYGALAELVAIFILRNPVTARVGAVIPLVVIGLSFMIAEWRGWFQPGPGPTTVASMLAQGAVLVAGGVPCLITIVSLCVLLWYPPKSNIHFARRLSELTQVPPSLKLMPKSQNAPFVEYIRACTKPTDAFFEPWFAGELYFFSGRAFAAGLPVVFGDHWSEPTYQRHAIQRLETQAVPIILTEGDELGRSHEMLWGFIIKRYDRSRTVKMGSETPEVTIWTRRDLPMEHTWGPLSLPCFADGS
jgi:hypothetical protein